MSELSKDKVDAFVDMAKSMDADYSAMYEKFCKVLDLATDGRITNPLTSYDEIEQQIYEVSSNNHGSFCKESVAEFVRSGCTAVCPASGPVWSEITRYEVESWFKSKIDGGNYD